ncbi:hypothetical protein [Clostridium sp. JN-9]|nr:hypothetical protein [Clostridium sp. JN-9]
MQVVEVVPFHSFKERLQLVKQFIGKGTIIIYDTFIYFEKLEGESDD